ncbi:hypothetical protein [uncultured Cohaesibacter sp.]|uniref:hypothetical protein n=1 Tax=uncultured Cohaesibacter sp. TaxID=1002546 RepID=UPI0029C8F185|nr:hypothetical protein [uncultured Cohaesibacter sp.]
MFKIEPGLSPGSFHFLRLKILFGCLLLEVSFGLEFGSHWLYIIEKEQPLRRTSVCKFRFRRASAARVAANSNQGAPNPDPLSDGVALQTGSVS